jgi:hypothetical protein
LRLRFRYSSRRLDIAHARVKRVYAMQYKADRRREKNNHRDQGNVDEII